MNPCNKTIIIVNTINHIPSNQQFMRLGKELSKENKVIHISDKRTTKYHPNVRTIKWEKKTFLHSSLFFLKIALKYQPNFIILTFGATRYTFIFWLFPGIQSIVFIRSAFTNNIKKYNLLRYLPANKIIFISHYVKSIYAKTFPFFNKGYVVLNSIDTTQIRSTEKKQKKILFAGALKKHKGPDLLLEAYAHSEIRKQYELVLIGKGNMYPHLLEQVKKYGIEDTVTFTGLLSHQEVLQHMGQAEIFVLPSRFDAFGQVIIEAMCNGCLCVGAKETGAQEIIQHQINGFLFENNSADSLATTLTTILHLDKKQKDVLLLGAKNSLPNFDQLRWVHKIITVLET